MRNRTLISVSDLRLATIRCPQCNTQVTIDLDIELYSPGRATFRVPRECPRCHAPFDSAIPAALEAMQKVYKALSPLTPVDAVSFTSVAEPEQGERTIWSSPEKNSAR